MVVVCCQLSVVTVVENTLANVLLGIAIKISKLLNA
jgi:hypothetical protein